MSPSTRTESSWSDAALDAIEAAHPEGMTVQQIVEVMTERGEWLTEPTFRKYVQMGLLPRSVRVGRKGKHRGSQGLYPATVVRQLVQLRRLMAEGFTIGELQAEFLFVRGDIEALSRQLERVFEAISRSTDGQPADDMVSRSIGEAKALGSELVTKLEAIERRLSTRARMRRAVV